VLNLGVPTAYLSHAKPDRILGQLGLDGPGIAASIFRAIEHVEHLGPGGPAEPPESASDLGASNGSGLSAANGLVEHLGLPAEQQSSGV
jgi:hypothetical protein